MMQIVTGIATVESRIHSFFHNHNLGRLLRQSNIRKNKGVRLDTLFQFLLALAFTGKNMFRLLESADSPASIGKDFYVSFMTTIPFRPFSGAPSDATVYSLHINNEAL